LGRFRVASAGWSPIRTVGPESPGAPAISEWRVYRPE
jgi:hypothetical protein